MEFKLFKAGNIKTVVFRVKMDTTGSSEMLIFIYQTTYLHIRKYSNLDF
jgi:hypothetical protein